MDFLNEDDKPKAVFSLKMAEKIVTQIVSPEMMYEEPKKQILALTYNNLGCYYKKCQKPNVSLKYMLNALHMETDCELPTASTKLNICAILSQLQRHNESIKYCASGITDLMAALKTIKIKCMTDREK